MAMVTRRTVLGVLATGAAGAAVPLLSRPSQARLAIVGGGAGGLAAAEAVRVLAPETRLTIIETLADGAAHRRLAADGVTILTEAATDIDPVVRRIRTTAGTVIEYDALVFAPGIGFRTDVVAGYGADAEAAFPHAWTRHNRDRGLGKRLDAVPDGGTVIISVPEAPFSFPAGPVLRAENVAAHLLARRRRIKVLVLDANDTAPLLSERRPLWAARFPAGSIEWVPGHQGGRVTAVDAATGAISGDAGRFRADLINLIPPQRAHDLALSVGLADTSGWCPVDAATLASATAPDIAVIGDANAAAPSAKTAETAGAQAIRAVRALLAA